MVCGDYFQLGEFQFSFLAQLVLAMFNTTSRVAALDGETGETLSAQCSQRHVLCNGVSIS